MKYIITALAVGAALQVRPYIPHEVQVWLTIFLTLSLIVFVISAVKRWFHE